MNYFDKVGHSENILFNSDLKAIIHLRSYRMHVQRLHHRPIDFHIRQRHTLWIITLVGTPEQHIVTYKSFEETEWSGASVQEREPLC